MICDFCSAPEPLYEIPVRSFSMEAIRCRSVGSFMACGICKDFVDRNDRDGLFGYVVRTFTMKYPYIMQHGKLDDIVALYLHRLQDHFWENRIGQ